MFFKNSYKSLRNAVMTQSYVCLLLPITFQYHKLSNYWHTCMKNDDRSIIKCINGWKVSRSRQTHWQFLAVSSSLSVFNYIRYISVVFSWLIVICSLLVIVTFSWETLENLDVIYVFLFRIKNLNYIWKWYNINIFITSKLFNERRNMFFIATNHREEMYIRKKTWRWRRYVNIIHYSVNIVQIYL